MRCVRSCTCMGHFLEVEISFPSTSSWEFHIILSELASVHTNSLRVCILSWSCPPLRILLVAPWISLPPVYCWERLRLCWTELFPVLKLLQWRVILEQIHICIQVRRSHCSQFLLFVWILWHQIWTWSPCPWWCCLDCFLVWIPIYPWVRSLSRVLIP